jgi:hypothetical protein
MCLSGGVLEHLIDMCWHMTISSHATRNMHFAVFFVVGLLTHATRIGNEGVRLLTPLHDPSEGPGVVSALNVQPINITREGCTLEALAVY